MINPSTPHRAPGLNSGRRSGAGLPTTTRPPYLRDLARVGFCHITVNSRLGLKRASSRPPVAPRGQRPHLRGSSSIAAADVEMVGAGGDRECLFLTTAADQDYMRRDTVRHRTIWWCTTAENVGRHP